MLGFPFTTLLPSSTGSVPKLTKVLKPSGHLSHIMNHGTDRDALQKLQDGEGPSASLTLVKPNGAQLAEIFELIAAGKVKLEVAKVSAGVRCSSVEFGPMRSV